MDRTKGNLQVNTVLTELERHEGLCILATNRPMDLDEAMHRRITLAIEFSKPDLLLREKIWRSMAPPKLPLSDDVDFMLLARKCAARTLSHARGCHSRRCRGLRRPRRVPRPLTRPVLRPRRALSDRSGTGTSCRAASSRTRGSRRSRSPSHATASRRR